ncbi:MAG: hypothetical protein KF735_06140 [Chelatococcus sp.]|jgi:hypothetical protein|uniref:hypothetical protein n=1 Tax=unclassified Chelatococcus TaxID=2638111 RepID=UPI001BCC15AE|nr:MULTISPECIES: hypothetical protein [unclassified Chelatococcus]MBS7740913.1 hypothetical protein [Chelatococcus sp. HY11]MBX3537192.1 hypothetical protein [Chelatococcus sp.]MBX3546796.1 hypothetical protein [Chelatococcus sp.]MCO5077731.1 hypothetical protein [Chelatococcus sp.]
MASSEPVAGPTETPSDSRRLIVGLSAVAAVLTLFAGVMLWASQGDGVFLAWITTAVAGCF